MVTVTAKNNTKAKSRIQGAFKSFEEWKVRRQTAQQLKKLNDRQLQDIGLSRYEINSVADSISKKV